MAKKFEGALGEQINKGIELAEQLEQVEEVSQPDPMAVEPTRTIRVTRLFQGRLTKEQPIQPGVYDKKSPALYGIGDYLVNNGFAEYVTVEG